MHDTPDNGTPALPTGDGSTPQRSFLGQLAARRNAIANRLEFHLPIPRWEDPVVVVIYRPVDEDWRANRAREMERLTGRKRTEAEFRINCDMLIRSCVGIYARDPDDPEARLSLHPDGVDMPLTTFDPDLARTMDMTGDLTAQAVLRRMFYTDADILSATAALVEWSGYRKTDADEELRGE